MSESNHNVQLYVHACKCMQITWLSDVHNRKNNTETNNDIMIRLNVAKCLRYGMLQ